MIIYLYGPNPSGTLFPPTPPPFWVYVMTIFGVVFCWLTFKFFQTVDSKLTSVWSLLSEYCQKPIQTWRTTGQSSSRSWPCRRWRRSWRRPRTGNGRRRIVHNNFRLFIHDCFESDLKFKCNSDDQSVICVFTLILKLEDFR